MDPVLHIVMELESNCWCPLCYRTPVLAKLSTKVFQGLYLNYPPVPVGTFSGEFKSCGQKTRKGEKKCT